MPNDGSAATVKSAMRTLDILEYLVAQQRPMAAHELSTILAIPVSSLSYLLTTLSDRGYLSRVGRRYVPGPALGRLAAAQPPCDLIDRMTPIVRSLSTQLDESVGFFVQKGYEVETLISAQGTQALRYNFEVGRRRPMHATTAGKALLAHFDEAALAEYFASSVRTALAPNTIIGEAELRAEIAEIRRTGLTRTREEVTRGIHSLGCGVEIDGAVVGAISISVPLARLDADLEKRATALLRRASYLLAAPAAAALA